jgi:capsular exopolysaccharide synthesis family protein
MANNKQSDFIDIKGLLLDYVSKWYYFVISVIICVFLAYCVSRIKPQDSGVRANVLISQEDNNQMSNVLNGAIGDIFGASGNVDDEIFVISSHSLYRDVVRDLGINTIHRVKDGFLSKHLAYPNYPIDLTPAPGIIDTLSISLTVKAKVDEHGKVTAKMKYKWHTIAEVEDAPLPAVLNSPVGQFTLSKTPSFPEGQEVSTTIFITGYDTAADLLALDITSDIASKRSNVINLAINTPNSDYGKDVLNEIIKKYNERGIIEKNMQGQKTAEFIEQRIALIADDLSDSEVEIQNYKEHKGIIDVTTEATYQTTKRAQVETALLSTETQAEIVKMTSEFISNPDHAYDLIPTSVENAGLQSAIQNYNNLVLRRMDLVANAKTDNAAVKRLSDQIDAMRANITATINKVYENLAVQLRDLRTEKATTLGRLSDVPAQEREFLDMKRQQAVKQELYLFLLKRREETAMLLANAVPKGLVVDEAYTLSDPIGLSTKVLLLLGFLVGLCLPPVFIYLRKLIRNKFDTRQEVEKIATVPILGEICTDKTGNNLVVGHNETSSTSELFRLLRANLLFVLNDVNDKVVLMTSTKSGEGKTFVSINLAATFALLKKRVLLIGMDIRNPQLANYLHIAPRFGLTQYLTSSEIALDSIITPSSEINGLDIIVAGPVPPNPAELLESHKVDETFAELRKRYDYIIVDSAPVGMVSDTFSLDRIADATVYVCRVNYTPTSDIRFVNEIGEQHRLRKLSLVVNGTATKRSYGYGYGYGQGNTKTHHSS